MASRARPHGSAGRSPRSPANSRTGLNQRTHLAQAAARLIAEGLNDYRAAKHKAARQLGLSGAVAMPDDAEIESALREHQRLFGDPNLADAVRNLQRAALETLERLAQFSPWLTGPILSGAATAHSDIEVEIVGVAQKDFELYMLNRALPFDLSPAGYARPDLQTRYAINFGQYIVCCTIFRTEAERRAALSENDRKMERAQLQEARARFAHLDATRA